MKTAILALLTFVVTFLLLGGGSILFGYEVDGVAMFIGSAFIAGVVSGVSETCK